ncbi:MAG: phosphoenolpyruvate carboxykinase (ATP) [Gammaproteobacteria bacterium]|nr:phosphoenolpyruvate carboxykinase (ATP) [Gammaproteobacteria bacterium]
MAANYDDVLYSGSRFNLSSPCLVEQVIQNGEGNFASNGALVVNTGERTGRSPRDRFIVEEPSTSKKVDWGEVNQPIAQSTFNQLWARVSNYLSSANCYVQELHVGADPEHYLPLRVTAEYAWHALFARNMFIQLEQDYNPKHKPVWLVLCAPNFVCDPARDGVNSECTVMIDFSQKSVLIAGMRYAGELKKAMFSVLNFVLPEFDVLPMHCSANIDDRGRVALFFGLSGTGKTTLSADPNCALIGDDEHGWAVGGVFNFEGGCYAKCINLSRENEPLIYDALRYGSILENVVIDVDTREPNYEDSFFTENTRACYPRTLIEPRVLENRGPEPQTVFFLTCDVSGVLPPVSILSPQAAAYHFLLGYTAKVGSTEVGSTEAYSATFSACFGAAFLPRPPKDYSELLVRRIKAQNTQVFLINTGWTSGGYGVGERFRIPITRSIIKEVRAGRIDLTKTQHLPNLNLDIPISIQGVDSALLNPRNTWKDKDAYDQAEATLISKFKENFANFDVSAETSAAGPR